MLLKGAGVSALVRDRLTGPGSHRAHQYRRYAREGDQRSISVVLVYIAAEVITALVYRILLLEKIAALYNYLLVSSSTPDARI